MRSAPVGHTGFHLLGIVVLIASRLRGRYTAGKPRGPVLQNANEPAVATSTEKRGFVTPIFLGLVYLCTPVALVSGGMGLSARLTARLVPCFEHPAHLLRFKTQMVDSLIQPGIQTMTAYQPASRSAAPMQSNPHQMHADAHNALSMALYYLRDGNPSNVPAARRKAVQALVALRGLTLALED